MTALLHTRRLSQLNLLKRLLPPQYRLNHSMSHPPSSSQPPWLTSILNDTSPAPRIYSWTPPPSITPAGKTSNKSTNDDDDNARRIYILGVGNMGRLYASSLSKILPHPPPITLVFHRKDMLDDWESGNGIEITRLGITERDKTSFDVEYWTETPPGPEEGGTIREILTREREEEGEKESRKIGNLIIGTKASLAIPQVDRLRRYLGPQSTVAFAQNGMNKLWPPHGQAYAAHRYPDAASAPNFVHCITGHGFISLGPFRSRHAALADAKVGLVLPNSSSSSSSTNAGDGDGDGGNRAEYLMGQIAAAPHLDSLVVPRADLWALQLEKLVFNTIINPLTAVLRVKNGVLFEKEDGPLSKVMDHLLQQTSAVYQALVNHPSTADILSTSSSNSSSSSSSNAPSDLHAARQHLTRRFSFDTLRAILWEFGHKVGENRSSMFQDVTAGKETEIRDLNGWIVDMARFLDANRRRSSTAITAATTTAAGATPPSPPHTSHSTHTPGGDIIATKTTAGVTALAVPPSHHLDVSAHETLIDLIESGRVLDQEGLAKALLPK